MEIIKKEATKNISVRIPNSVYELATDIAKKEGVRPADVYRSILVSFFKETVNNSDTDMSTFGSTGPGAA